MLLYREEGRKNSRTLVGWYDEDAPLKLIGISIGVAIGSVIINALLKGKISARYSPASVIAMAVCVLAFAFEAKAWVPAPGDTLYGALDFVTHPQSLLLLGTLALIAIFGGMFVVPLYAFLTTTVTKDQTARTVAANNVVNCASMTVGAISVILLTKAGLGPTDMLLIVAGMCLVSAWLAWRLHRACDDGCPA